ncbi:DUF4129 domain-containing protein [Frondihabitans cladoniiphilus]|uniref:Protein-glutamine gamma-glutamyltransferase-like C-terminal domain-containing protein n=1 Tax=Frondihabitans cladoniiphilus TaxID=715785 RepID=A0ABP8WCD8_9MICO
MTAPLTPSSGDARRLLEQELAKQEYQASKPGLIDRLATAFFDWVESIHFGSVSGAPALAIAVLLFVVVGVIVVLLLVYGLPRFNRHGSVEAPLFGDDDTREAAALRASAATAAAAGDYSRAVVEAYRAIARALGERGALEVTPGTTAHAFGERAALLFPDHGRALTDAARRFDEVRYLDRAGSAAAYESLAALDRELERTTPVQQASTLEGARS